MAEDFENIDNLIEITDESGNVIKCELYDIVEFEGNQYAVLAEYNEDDTDEDPEIVLMKYSEDSGNSYFETIEDDDEFERVSEFIDTLDYDEDEYYESDYDDEDEDFEEEE